MQELVVSRASALADHKTVVVSENDVAEAIKSHSPLIVVMGETKMTVPYQELENQLGPKMYRMVWKPDMSNSSSSGVQLSLFDLPSL